MNDRNRLIAKLKSTVKMELKIEKKLKSKIVDFTGAKNEEPLGKRMERPPPKTSRKIQRKVNPLRAWFLCKMLKKNQEMGGFCSLGKRMGELK